MLPEIQLELGIMKQEPKVKVAHPAHTGILFVGILFGALLFLAIYLVTTPIHIQKARTLESSPRFFSVLDPYRAPMTFSTT